MPEHRKMTIVNSTFSAMTLMAVFSSICNTNAKCWQDGAQRAYTGRWETAGFHILVHVILPRNSIGWKLFPWSCSKFIFSAVLLMKSKNFSKSNKLELIRHKPVQLMHISRLQHVNLLCFTQEPNLFCWKHFSKVTTNV